VYNQQQSMQETYYIKSEQARCHIFRNVLVTSKYSDDHMRCENSW